MQKKESFHCIKTRCGFCCERIENVLKLKGHGPKWLDELIDDFPYKLIDGQCPKYKYRRCTVYDDRPLLCNIDKIYDKYPEVATSRIDWHNQNYNCCNILIEMMEKEKIEVFRQALGHLGMIVFVEDAEMIYKLADLVRRKGENLSFKMLNEIKNQLNPNVRLVETETVLTNEAVPGQPVRDDDAEPVEEVKESTKITPD